MIHPRMALAILLLGGAGPACAGQCETNFRKSGNPFTGTDYASQVRVPDQSVHDALHQVRGIMIAEKMDVLTEDAEEGSMLVEQRSSGATRAIPTLVQVDADGADALVAMTIKTEKGQFAKSDAMRDYLCGLMGRLQGGAAGRAAAAQGAKTRNRDDVTAQDVYVFSREVAQEAKGNALAVTARRHGRKYALKGRVDYIQQDGDEYNVSFEIPRQEDVAFRAPGDHEGRVGVACLFRASQLASVLTFRKGDRAEFTGVFLRYDDLRRMVWLEDCKQTRR